MGLCFHTYQKILIFNLFDVLSHCIYFYALFKLFQREFVLMFTAINKMCFMRLRFLCQK